MSSHTHKPSIPAITIDNSDAAYDEATRSASTQDAPSPIPHGHSRSPSDPNYLAPGASRQHSHSASEEPPSPTGSASSVKFATSLDLRNNQPTAHSGADSLTLLNPAAGGGANSKHGRKNSATSLTSAEGTEPDHAATNKSPHSATTSITAVPTTPKHKSKFSKGKENSDEEDEKKEEEEQAKPHEIADVADPAPFAFRPKQLAELAESKSLKAIDDIGGVDKLIEGLGTDKAKGLSAHATGQAPEGDEKSGGEGAFSATIQDRQRVFGTNTMPAKKSKSLLMLMWLAFQDKVLILLSIAAVISLALGLYQDLGVHETEPCPDDPSKDCTPPKVDFVEGVAIIIAILIVVLVGSLNDWQKERQFRALNEKKEDRTVKVIRQGSEREINIKEVMVGDIAIMEPGEIIPCDGIYVSGHNLKCDESGATGESDAIKKFTYEDAVRERTEKGETKKDCFILSGSKVLEGVGSYVVIAVGERSFNGRILMALQKPVAATPLQEKLNNLAELIAKVGGACGLILFSSLMIKFFVQLKTKPNRSANEKAMSFVQILIISVTLVVVAVPEGLPLAVTLALAFATKRMTKENLLVRVLESCETMANATVVCTDKTGTLTQNAMSVVAGSVGVHAKFVKNLKDNLARAEDKENGDRKHSEDFPIEQDDLNKILSPALRRTFNEAIAVNSTAFEDINKETGALEFVGSKTETALLRFAKDLQWRAYRETRSACQVVQLLPFASERKYMGVIIRHGDKYRVYFKGASEILTKQCTRHVVVGHPDHPPPGGSEDDEVETKGIDSKTRENINNTIIFYANQMLRTIALCYKEVDVWPPPGKGTDEVPLSELANNLVLIGITGIEDPLRPSVRDAITDAHHAGVVVKMCTGDNVLTARSIAAQCGIYGPGGIIMEGPVFRNLSKEEREKVVPHLQVLARSSPEDKKILVETLMSQGEVVGVTGDGTNDGPALKEANVGFSMGIAGTEVAKEASDIILMDDNFASIVSAIIWGRCVNDSVRKFLQFQISVNITAVLITFISAVASDEEQSVLTAVQLLWINIIMDTFAALALATDPGTRKLLDRKPDRRDAPLFTVEMSKMILSQALYQTFVVLLLHFAGPEFFHVSHEDRELSTLVFNVFVWCQIFNSVNCRTIDGDKNVFRGILKNWYFIAITLFEVGVQIVIVYVGGAAFSVQPIHGKYWGISIGLGFVSLPLGYLVRSTPNGPIERILIKMRIMRDPNTLPTVSPTAEQYNEAIDSVRDDLGIFANIRGGRVRGSSLALKSRKKRMQEANIRLPQLMSMVPALVASSVAARWQPKSDGLHDPANGDPSKSSAALWDGKLQLHPETERNHPAFQMWGAQMEKKPSRVSQDNRH
ncbi:calcium-translocating P-type ATPase [Serendipita vermifera]|nr:calcium-translocating P-type ATPase [Serendipita vermifera]